MLQKHDRLRPDSWTSALHSVSRSNSQHPRSPRQKCAGTNGDRRKAMTYQILIISSGWKALVTGLQQWQQVVATQPTPAAREGSAITQRPGRGLHVTSAPGGTIVSASAYATRRQKQLILRAMPAHTFRRPHTTPFHLLWLAAIPTSPFSLFSARPVIADPSVSDSTKPCSAVARKLCSKPRL